MKNLVTMTMILALAGISAAPARAANSGIAEAAQKDSAAATAVPKAAPPADTSAPAAAPTAVREAVIEKNSTSNGSSLVYYRTDLSEEMPEAMKEWSANVFIVPENWREDGIITGKEDAENFPESLTLRGDIVMLVMTPGVSVKPGDIFKTYIKGARALDSNGKKIGKELEPTGRVTVISAKGGKVRARIISANTSVDRGQIVKK